MSSSRVFAPQELTSVDRGEARAIAPRPSPKGTARHGRPTLGAIDDPREREADRIADAIVRAPGALASFDKPHAPSAPTLRRKCNACAGKNAEDEEPVLRKANARATCSACGERGAEGAADAVSRGGTPLTSSARAFFEPRFRHDFSRVRIHDDARAADAADAIHARAFSLGDHIAFARGEYAPSTGEGTKLLAHELAHVVQAESGGPRNVIARQPASPSPYWQRTFQDRSGGGTTDFVETVQNAPTTSGNIVTGRVDRAEFAPATATQPREDISPRGQVNVQFDTQTCTLFVPHTFSFAALATATAPFCQSPPNATAVPTLSNAAVQQWGQTYVSKVQEGLDNRFSARVSGCKNKCADRDIQIRPRVSLVASGGDTPMNVVNRGGRGNAGTICLGEWRDDFPVHESGHQVLAMGDEYREVDPTLLQRNPKWGRNERVRDDLTRMGPDVDYKRFSLFQERHFRFAQVFLEAAFRGCSVTLQAASRPVPDFRVELHLGGASLSGGSAATFGIGANVGLPLTRRRELELRLGAQGIYLLTLPPLYRSALLVGATLGLEARTSPASFSGSFGVFASSGLYHQFGSDGIPGYAPSTAARTSGYAEGGISLGLLSAMSSGAQFGLRVDAALGTEITRDPDAMRWLRVGASFGGTF